LRHAKVDSKPEFKIKQSYSCIPSEIDQNNIKRLSCLPDLQSDVPRTSQVRGTLSVARQKKTQQKILDYQ
jgi:hypothetical protein